MTTYNIMTIEIGIHDGDAIGWFDNEEWKGLNAPLDPKPQKR